MGAGISAMSRKGQRFLSWRVMLWIVALIALTGCTKFYWGEKPGGSTLEAFGRDTVSCNYQVGLPVEGQPGYALINPNAYRSCMLAKGWKRAELMGNPPPGWFRGIEDEEIRPYYSIPPQPEPDPNYDLR